MDELLYIYKGLLIGLMVSVPLGPMGVLLVQKTLQKGALAGFIAAMGIVFADLCYSVIAAYGVGFIIDIVSAHELYLKILGGIFLIVLGTRTYFINPLNATHRKNKVSKKGMLGDFFTFFVLTISNPMAIFIFMAVFAGTAVFDSSDGLEVRLFAFLGIALGAISWWYLLVSFVNIFRKRIKLRALMLINKVSGVIVSLIGVGVILSAI